MSEAIKTLIFAGVALVVTLVAVFTYPKQESFKAPSLVGKDLFADFKDPEAAADLKIVKFTEDVGQLSEFEVARDKTTGLWVIPSSSNYPADADTQMRSAATALIGLQVIDIASEQASEHEMYGVVEPNKEKLDASQKGVGLLVEVRNSKGKKLAQLIIGKLVKGSEQQRFVRKPGQNPVYIVKIDPNKFPTEFDKWIERDLLKVNTFDVEKVVLKDYSILTATAITGQTVLQKFERRFEADMRWVSDKGEWKLEKLIEYRNDRPVDTKLLDTEELNKQKLDDLKSALGELKIVGVRRKPKGLGADLKAGKEIMDNKEGLASLIKRGFFPIKEGSGAAELRAANGEVLVSTKDGVQYVLRFGQIAGVDKNSDEGKLNRYLFVTTRVDSSQIPKPELAPLPEGDAKPKDAEKKDAEKKDSAKMDKKKDAKADAEKANGDAPKAEDEKSDLELKREQIRKENQRKTDQYEESLKKAKDKVKELNSRFADWYYVIAEDEYKKIHITRDDLIKEKASAKEEGYDIDAFRKLEKDGLKKKTEANPSAAGGPMPQFGGPR